MVDALTGRIETIEIEDEMRSSYIDYAMSVIVGRALPDVRDGLKPVHRRILYGMHEMGILPGKPYKKCARMVGDVMGKYHPHGDSAIYDTLVRMAQSFSMRYELIDGHGNFGSVDGDSPAAMRYTEARLSKLAVELLRDLDKKTVDFVPNYDETEQEPVVLPARYPNLLVNGSSGIAVGMATNIPPHNLNEVIDATIKLIDNPDSQPGDLMQIVKGPDFPTGGTIMGRSGIRDAYETGRGSIKVRGKAHMEQTKSNKTRIIISELPYQVNKARLTEKIAELVREKKISEISDLRDESDRSGMRLVVELKREAIPQVVLNKLYKHTQLETSFGVIMLALVEGIPRTLSLSQVLHHYIEHQKEIIVRRTRFELEKAEARAHILEGLLIALNNLDEVIKTIRQSKTVDEARKRLIANFNLSEIQAQAILDMRLQRLTALESQKIELEYKELLEKIALLKRILASEQMILDIIKEELTAVKERFGDERRTQIVSAAAELEIEDLIAEEDMVITITRSGYIKRLPVTTYRQQARGGKGVSGTNLKEGDFVEHLFISSTHNFILFFSNKGKVYKIKVHELPTASRTARGHAIVNVLPFAQDEKIAAVISTKVFEEDQYLMMATKKGVVKKTPFKEYNTSRRDGILAISMREDDELIGVKITRGSDDMILVSRGGMSIRFNETDVRPMGRTATGVKGMRLAKDDEVLAVEVAKDEADFLIITDNGFGKRTPMHNYPQQGRGGKGVKTLKETSARGKVSAAKMVQERHSLMIISTEGIVMRTPVKQISQMGRNTQGVKIMNIKENDTVSAVALIVDDKDSPNGDEELEI
ncbi:MAG: DNA gyrase subunit A [Candidatus Aquicultor sp.]|nr:DNA gyrase subunit A [Candidatus Aquicultor sp.]